MMVHTVALLVPRRIQLAEIQLGQIGCGRQNPPVQSAEPPSTSLQDRKAATAPLLPQKRRWYDAGGFRYRSACTKQPRQAWMRVPESLVALAAEVRLTYIGVSKTNDRSRELTVPVQKTELVQTLLTLLFCNEQIHDHFQQFVLTKRYWVFRRTGYLNM
ncbi:Hypothetical_protein [Hexamita inflata]|uniref:Hypothetical_protein n=1 Tax=Hexamita inflata TaxID=28002 RepID=A0AA86U3I6_9EUKA|nr:Hypothetical protein HINF_LOCUS24302 [Hexamita inflata]